MSKVYTAFTVASVLLCVAAVILTLTIGLPAVIGTVLGGVMLAAWCGLYLTWLWRG